MSEQLADARARLAEVEPVVRAAVAYWLSVNGRPSADVSLADAVDALSDATRNEYGG